MNKKVYIISGGPGTGKSSTLNELKNQGYIVLPEVARVLALKDKRFMNKNIYEIDKKLFQDEIFKKQKQQLKNLKTNKPVFSDRGVGDTIAYYKLYKLKVPEKIISFARNFRYAEIFILEPLAVYVRDKLRKETREEQKKAHEIILKTYRDLGYDVVIVPFMSVKKRVKFIKENL